jgi:hypothetical protein
VTALPLPPGYAPAPAAQLAAVPPLDVFEPEPEVPAAPPAPALPIAAAVLTEATAASGALVTVHLADRTVTDWQRRQWTARGYAWRCTACRRIARHDHYGRALETAAAHACGEDR